VRRAARFIGDAVRLRDRPTPASAVVSESDSGDDRVELQSVGSGRRAKAVLAVGTAAPLGTAERYAVHSAIALLTLTTERSRALQEAEQRLGAAVLKMLLVGEGDHARAVAGQLYGGLLDAPMRVIVAEPASGAALRVAQESVLATHAARTRTGTAVRTGSVPQTGSASQGGSAAPAPESVSTIDQSGAAVGSRPGAASGNRGGAAPRQSSGPGPGSGPGDETRATAGVVVGSSSGPQTDAVDAGALGRTVWPLEELSDAMETAAARNGEAVLVVPDGARLVVLASDGGAAVAACGEFAATNPLAQPGPRGSGAGDEGLAIGVSAPIGLPAAAVAFKQADQALSVARRRGVPLVEHEDVAAGSVLPLLADDAVRAFADGLLRALREHDANGRGDLVASLRAWLSRHGQWDAAAAELGVHRHTLRYRMRRVEEILGRSLDDPDVRMELWLALKATS
jgi:purine catabolism regulator